MPKRWTLSRAGITNVYQYDNEILHFGAGRLLLRGVNGSGKSTAMNMLLPFLLEADTRRIDAAGEQAGVLRSWMLSGRDDAQPVGYLWVEFARGEDHLVCGCGIKANRSTDRVTTWWFVTDLRPGFDFALVENRIPLSVDSLRSTLGERAVFTSSERNLYRSEVRSRLFAGADIDQQIRLLHVIRNPRVGDRIDVDLPRHLEDALPPLSEPALDDAAQPLEDLEEHRRNVESLTETSNALRALGEVFGDYARTELHSRATTALQRANAALDQSRAVQEATRQTREAEAELAEATEKTVRLEDDIQRIEKEADALRASTAYESGQELESVRLHIKELSEALARAEAAWERAEGRRSRAAAALTAAYSTLEADRQTFMSGLGDLAGLTRRIGLAEVTPDLPAVPVQHDGDVATPAGDWALDSTRVALGEVRGGAVRRSSAVDEVDSALDRVDEAELRLQAAERDRAREEERVTIAAERHDAARRTLSRAIDDLRQRLAAWWDRLTETARAHSVSVEPIPELSVAELAESHHLHQRAAAAATDTLADHLQKRVARLSAQADRQRTEVAERVSAVEELDRLELPSPPSLPWQRQTSRPKLAEMIDFAADLEPDECLGLEAAMEAAGLLGAELTDSGALRLESGELVVTSESPAPAPLSELVAVSIPDGADVDPRRVRAVLESISTDTGAGGTAVCVDGTFRIGALKGRHHKEIVEHVGSGARKAALERRRAEAAALLAEAETALTATELELDQAHDELDQIHMLRNEIPSTDGVSDALAAAATAEIELEETRRGLGAARQAEEEAERTRAAAVAETERLAAELGLAASRDGLAQTRRLLAETSAAVDHLTGNITILERSFLTWTSAAEDWREARAETELAESDRAELRSSRQREAARLATLEDAVGLEYREVLAALEQCEHDRTEARRHLQEARQRKEQAITAAATHRQVAQAAEDRRLFLERDAVDELRRLRAALAVPGLADAADTGPEELPGVEESSTGLAALATALAAATPTPRSEINADGVRQSLRRRRDTLGAGWDAEDRQPNPDLPLTVEINGPLGRMSLPAAVATVGSHRQQQAALLTTKQDQALRNLLQGLIAREVSDKLVAARELVKLMNDRLAQVSTSHGVGVQLRWRRREDLDPGLDTMIDLLGKPPDLRTPEEDDRLIGALSERISDARTADPELAYRDLVRQVLDYRHWHEMSLYITRAGDTPKKLSRRTPLSEGEKKIVTYLALFSAMAAAWDAVATAGDPSAPRFVLLDDAFAKVSEDNHAQLFGLLVEMDLDFIATSERLWGTHDTVPELAITEVVRDADLGVILLEHARWNGQHLEEAG